MLKGASYIKKLTKRLEAMLDMIGRCDELIDIGADHGYLCAAAVMRGIAKHAYAADISQSSLTKAHKLANELCLNDKISFIVADGFSGYAPGSCFCAAIAGMGGELIASILENGQTAAHEAKRLVLQPMRGTRELREYLYKNGYGITDELIIAEGSRFYQLICCRYDGIARPCEDQALLEFGAIAYAKRQPELMTLLERTYGSISKRIEKAAAAGRAPESLIKELNGVRRLMDGWKQ